MGTNGRQGRGGAGFLGFVAMFSVMLGHVKSLNSMHGLRYESSVLEEMNRKTFTNSITQVRHRIT